MSLVRTARYDDIPELCSFVEKYHCERSNLKDIPFDRKAMAATLDYSLSARNHIIYVYSTDVGIKGFIMGSVEPFPHNRKYLWAGDAMFIADSGGGMLLKRFLSWAKANKAKRIYMAVSTGDDSADMLYEAMGMERTGGMYRVVL